MNTAIRVLITDIKILEWGWIFTSLAQRECDLNEAEGELLLLLLWLWLLLLTLRSQVRIYPSQWLVNNVLFEQSMAVVIESLVSNARCQVIFYTSMSFMEWSDEPVQIVFVDIQLKELIASLWRAGSEEDMNGRIFLVVLRFFLFQVFIDVWESSSRKF